MGGDFEVFKTILPSQGKSRADHLEEVKLWLEQNQLDAYFELLKDQEFDSMAAIFQLSRQLLQSIGITKAGAIEKFMLAIKESPGIVGRAITCFLTYINI